MHAFVYIYIYAYLCIYILRLWNEINMHFTRFHAVIWPGHLKSAQPSKISFSPKYFPPTPGWLKYLVWSQGPLFSWYPSHMGGFHLHFQQVGFLETHKSEPWRISRWVSALLLISFVVIPKAVAGGELEDVWRMIVETKSTTSPVSMMLVFEEL